MIAERCAMPVQANMGINVDVDVDDSDPAGWGNPEQILLRVVGRSTYKDPCPYHTRRTSMTILDYRVDIAYNL